MSETEQIERYARQHNIISQEQLGSAKIITVGLGVGGGWATYLLGKMGITDFELYDFDTVEDANLPAQLFTETDVGKYKVDCLAEKMAEANSGVNVIIHKDKVDEETIFELTGNTIVLNMVDSIDARKIVYEKLKGSPIWMIDARMGGQGWYITIVNCGDSEDCERYEETLKGKFVSMPCGEQSIIYSAMAEVSEIVTIVKKILVGQITTIPKEIRRDMNNYLLLASQR